MARATLLLVAFALCMRATHLALATAPAPLLIPQAHFLHGFEKSYVVMQFVAPKEFDVARILLPKGLTLKQQEFIHAFEKIQFELQIEPSPGADVNFDGLTIVDHAGKQQLVFVGPNRVRYLKPVHQNDLGFDLITQVPLGGVVQAVHVYNQTAQPLELLSWDYAPDAMMAGKVLFQNGYEANWFEALEKFMRDGGRGILPNRTFVAKSQALNIVLQPGRSTSLAVTRSSFIAPYDCSTGKTERRSQLSGIIRYRVGKALRAYAIPDDVMYPVCF